MSWAAPTVMSAPFPLGSSTAPAGSVSVVMPRSARRAAILLDGQGKPAHPTTAVGVPTPWKRGGATLMFISFPHHPSCSDSLPRVDLRRTAAVRGVAEDRRLRPAGYEFYRFGGRELTQPHAERLVGARHRMPASWTGVISPWVAARSRRNIGRPMFQTAGEAPHSAEGPGHRSAQGPQSRGRTAARTADHDRSLIRAASRRRTPRAVRPMPQMPPAAS